MPVPKKPLYFKISQLLKLQYIPWLALQLTTISFESAEPDRFCFTGFQNGQIGLCE
jgi:hypothetical protein